MATGERFSKLLRQELACRAVWPPVLTPITLGDYGLLDGAEFRKLGNIADFGVNVAVEAGCPRASTSRPATPGCTAWSAT